LITSESRNDASFSQDFLSPLSPSADFGYFIKGESSNYQEFTTHNPLEKEIYAFFCIGICIKSIQIQIQKPIKRKSRVQKAQNFV